MLITEGITASTYLVQGSLTLVIHLLILVLVYLVALHERGVKLLERGLR